MRRRIRKHRSAENDLIQIWQYTFEEWDAAQADKYLDEIDHAVQLLADNPEMGVTRDFVRAGYRVLFVGSHAVNYTFTRSTIQIRVLHGKMDPERHL